MHAPKLPVLAFVIAGIALGGGAAAGEQRGRQNQGGRQGVAVQRRGVVAARPVAVNRQVAARPVVARPVGVRPAPFVGYAHARPRVVYGGGPRYVAIRSPRIVGYAPYAGYAYGRRPGFSVAFSFGSGAFGYGYAAAPYGYYAPGYYASPGYYAPPYAAPAYYGAYAPPPNYYAPSPGYVSAAPAQAPDSGGVRMQVRPDTAEVWVNGAYAGLVADFDGRQQPLTLDAGVHRVEVRAPGYETLVFDLRVQANQTTTYRADMTPSRPF